MNTWYVAQRKIDSKYLCSIYVDHRQRIVYYWSPNADDAFIYRSEAEVIDAINNTETDYVVHKRVYNRRGTYTVK